MAHCSAPPVRRRGRRSAPPPRRQGRSAGRAGLALLALLAIAAPARATVVVAKDFAALCSEADLIFVGTVTAVTSDWTDAQHRDIRTRVTFGALTWLRGGAESTLTLRFAGGEIDGLREEVAGVPHFAIGQRRIVFARAGAYMSPLVGFNQGLFQVVDGADGPLVLDADGRAVTDVARAALQRGAPGDLNAAVTLDAFLARVRDALETQ